MRRTSRAGLRPGAKIAVPAISTSAPSPPTISAVSRLTPPSTWTSPPQGLSASRRRAAGTFASATSRMNDWPPKPGSTVITITMSRRCRYGSSAVIGVPGRIARPAARPAARMRRRIGSIGSSTSTWTVIESQPAARKSSSQRPGSAIIRCASNGVRVTGRSDAIVPHPKVRFGTNRASITSRWIRSAPALTARRTSRARFARSEFRMLAAMRARPSPISGSPADAGGGPARGGPRRGRPGPGSRSARRAGRPPTPRPGARGDGRRSAPAARPPARRPAGRRRRRPPGPGSGGR